MAIIKFVIIVASLNFAMVIPVQAKHLDNIVIQHRSVKTVCLPLKMKTAIRKLQHRLGRNIIITSGHRNFAKKRSYHRSCKAVDFRVKGVSPSTIRKAVRSIPEIGGYGTYKRKPGLYHIDIGPTRTWHH